MATPFGQITANLNVIYPRYDPAKFVGRGWLVKRIAQFRDSSDGRHLVIVGEPGSGKSAFMAYLAETWNCPRHFIRADNLNGVTGVDPRAFLVSVATQLHQKYGSEIFKCEEKVRTNVTVGMSKDQAEVVGRVIEELHTPLPFLEQEREVDVKVGVAMGKSKIVGERVKRLVSNAFSLPETTLLHITILQPIEKILELYPDEIVVVFVDALDESPEHLGVNIIDVLPKAADPDFPSNLRLVMTSRSGDHLNQFRKKDMLYLDDKKEGYWEESLHDARLYIEQRLQEEDLSGVIDKISEQGVNEFINEIGEKSDGNFLYLYYYLNALPQAVKEGEINFEDLSAPENLNEIYNFFVVNRIKKKTGLRDWVELYLPILGILAVIFEPVSRQQIACFAGITVGYVDFIISELQQFLDVLSSEKGNLYRFYHVDFADYLLDSSRNREFPLDGPQYHNQIVNYYRDKNGQWHNFNDDGYIYDHLVRHMLRADQPEAIYSLLREETSNGENGWYYVKRKLNHTQSFLTDVICAWILAEESGDFINQVRYALMFSSVIGISWNLAPELILGAVKYEYISWDEALEYTRQKPIFQSDALIYLVQHLPKSILPKALELVRGMRDGSNQAEALIGIVQFLPEELLGKALDIAFEIPQGDDFVQTLVAFTPRLVEENMWLRILNVIKEIDDTKQKTLLKAVAENIPEALFNIFIQIIRDLRIYEGLPTLAILAKRIPLDGWPQYLNIVVEYVETTNAPYGLGRVQKCEVLAVLAPHIPLVLLPQVIEEARNIGNIYYQRVALIPLLDRLGDSQEISHLVEEWTSPNITNLPLETFISTEKYLPFNENINVFKQIIERPDNEDKLSALVPSLAEDQLQQAFEILGKHEYRDYYSSSLLRTKLLPRILPTVLEYFEHHRSILGDEELFFAIAPHVTEAILPRVIEMASKDSIHLEKYFVTLLLNIPNDLLSQALEISKNTIGGWTSWPDILALITPHVQEDILPQITEYANQIEELRFQSRVLAALALRKKPDEAARQVGRLIRLSQRISYAPQLSRLLISLAPDLPSEILPEIMELSFRTSDKDIYTYERIIIDFAPLFSQDIFDRMLRVLSEWAPSVEYIPKILAQHLPQDLLPSLIKTMDLATRNELLPILASRLPEILPETLNIAREDKDLCEKIIDRLAPNLPTYLFPCVLEIISIAEENKKEKLLQSILPRLPKELLPKALGITKKIQNSTYRSLSLIVLSPYLEGNLLSQAIDAARKIDDPRYRSIALSALSHGLQHDEILQILEVISGFDNYDLITALLYLLPNLPENRKAGAEKTILDKISSKKWSTYNKYLLSRLSTDQMAAILENIRQSKDLSYLSHISLYVQEDLLPTLLEIAKEIGLLNLDIPLLFMNIIPRLGISSLNLALDIALGFMQINNQPIKILTSQLSNDLAPFLSAEFEKIIKGITNDPTYMDKLAPYIPDNLLPRAVEVANRFEINYKCIKALAALNRRSGQITDTHNQELWREHVLHELARFHLNALAMGLLDTLPWPLTFYPSKRRSEVAVGIFQALHDTIRWWYVPASVASPQSLYRPL